MTHAHAIARIKRIWVDAIHIKAAGPCHCRHKAAMYSLQLESHEETNAPDERGREHCGYWCSRCEFSNAGSREVSKGERE